MQLISTTQRAPLARLLRFVLVVTVAIVLGASCGSDDSIVDAVTSTTAGSDGDTSADQLETDDTEAEPLATTAPISSTTDTGEGDDDSGNSAPTVLPAPTADSQPTPVPQSNDDTSETTSGASSGIDVGALSRNFGGNDTVCRSVLVEAFAAPDDAQAATACLLAEIAAGRPVVVDYGLVSTEGEPLYFRYAFDGTQTLVVNDSRLDTFGSPVVVAQLCQTIESGSLVPLAAGCTPSTSTGIAEADQ